MKRKTALLLAAALLLTGCAAQAADRLPTRYEATFLGLFDTVTTIVGYAGSEEEFRETAQTVHDELQTYHQLYDIYHDYPGLTNLKTVNDRAGIEPVAVDRKIIDLLLFCREMESATGGLTNPAMGSVLSLWHEARTAGLEDPASARLPDREALQEAARHTDFDDVIIDEAASTVFLRDPGLRLDVGAVAKGFAAEQVCKTAPEGLLVSVGGNVCCTGPKPDGSPWVVGLQNPDGGESLHKLCTDSGSVVTSGDYQRYYTVDDTRYHHIIDPATAMPGTLWRAVTVLCPDSGTADALSTALFLLPREEGQQLLAQFGAEAMWLDAEGNRFCSPGFSDRLKT